MSNDPKITLTVPGSVLTTVHLIGTRVNESLAGDGEHEARKPIRDALLAIEGALRAHGWRPNGDGSWSR